MVVVVLELLDLVEDLEVELLLVVDLVELVDFLSADFVEVVDFFDESDDFTVLPVLLLVEVDFDAIGVADSGGCSLAAKLSSAFGRWPGLVHLVGSDTQSSR